jgi:shikimate kinase
VVYLSATKQQLFERTRKDKNRPLLQVKDRKAVIDRLVREREPLYKEVADLIFPSGQVSPNKITKTLAEALAGL